MEMFKNLKIAQKLFVLIGVCILFISIVGYIGYYFNGQADRDMSSLYKDRTLPIEWLNRMHSIAIDNKVRLLGAMLDATDNNLDDMEKNLSGINTNAEEYGKYLKLYEATNLDQEEVDLLKTTKESLEIVREARTKEIQLIRQGKPDEAHSLYMSNKDTYDLFLEDLNKLAEYNVKVAEQIYKQNKANNSFANTLIVICIIIAGSLAALIGIMIANIVTKPIKEVVDNLNEIAHGNLVVKDLDNNSKDEIGMLATSLNTTAGNLRNLVSQVSKSVQDITAGSQEMNAASEQTAQGAQQVSTSVQQLAAGSQEQATSVTKSLENINNMNQFIQTVSSNADNTVSLSKSTENNADEGRNQADKAVGKINQIKHTASEISNTIDELGKLSSDIEQIVDLIKNIASQTNLLALNAAIEAARAGEHGKGFAVVAEEVKKLAGQSAEATDKITGMIKDIQGKTSMAVNAVAEVVNEVDDGVILVENTGDSLKEILNAAKVTSNQIEEISEEVNKLAANSDNVVKMMENISSITEESAASSEEIASIVEEQTASLQEINANSTTLAKLAENLQKQVNVFKI